MVPEPIGQGGGSVRRIGPRRASDLIGGILAKARTDAKRSVLTDALAEVLGAETSALVRVRSFRGGRLVLEVESAPLYAEFVGFRAERIREALNERLPAQKVAQLVFRMGGTGHV